MPTVSQVGNFTSGTFGFPIQFTLVDQDEAAVPLANLTSVVLNIVRSDLTQFSVNGPAGPLTVINISGGILQYVVQQGDLNYGGDYKYSITLNFNNGSRLVFTGDFKILQSARP